MPKKIQVYMCALAPNHPCDSTCTILSFCKRATAPISQRKRASYKMQQQYIDSAFDRKHYQPSTVN